MHGHTKVKFINAKQAKEAHQYRNTKEKLYKTNAAISYNKSCREKQLTPNYTSVKINGKNSQCQKTIKAATQYCLNQELKFLYVKKRICRIHLECDSSWQNSWHIIQASIDKKLQWQMESHYNHLNTKLDGLQHKQRGKTRTWHNNQEQQFYPRTKNLTNTNFTKDEMDLLNHGMQYSMHRPLKTYWTNLLVETQRTIKLIDTKIQKSYRNMVSKKMKQIFNSDNHHKTIQKKQLYNIRKLNL